MDDKQILENFQLEYQKKSDYLLSLWLKPSKKHNLPDATIVVDTSKPLDQLRADIWRNTKDKIKKAEKVVTSSEFWVLSSTSQEDYEKFYELYAKTADSKGFGAVTKKMRNKLTTDAINTWYGKLFIISDNKPPYPPLSGGKF